MQDKLQRLLPVDRVLANILECGCTPEGRDAKVDSDTLRFVREPFLLYLKAVHLDVDTEAARAAILGLHDELWKPNGLFELLSSELVGLKETLDDLDSILILHDESTVVRHIDFCFLTVFPVLSVYMQQYWSADQDGGELVDACCDVMHQLAIADLQVSGSEAHFNTSTLLLNILESKSIHGKVYSEDQISELHTTMREARAHSIQASEEEQHHSSRGALFLSSWDRFMEDFAHEIGN